MPSNHSSLIEILSQEPFVSTCAAKSVQQNPMKYLKPDLVYVNAALLVASAKEIEDAEFLLYSRIGTWMAAAVEYLPPDQNTSNIITKWISKWAPAAICVLGS